MCGRSGRLLPVGQCLEEEFRIREFRMRAERRSSILDSESQNELSASRSSTCSELLCCAAGALSSRHRTDSAKHLQTIYTTSWREHGLLVSVHAIELISLRATGRNSFGIYD
jgi:hypothetical protein